jgi:hypothetical protein
MEAKWISQVNKLEQIGPEGGVTLLNDELPDVGQIIIEKKNRNRDPKVFFAVTIILYNRFLNTSYYKSWEDALEHSNSVKLLIQATN